jgi:hypothetical protein
LHAQADRTELLDQLASATPDTTPDAPGVPSGS